MIPKEKLDALIENILAEQNFNYRNFLEAQKTFCVVDAEDKVITIDRITLYIYGSNLAWHDLDYVRLRLEERYTGECTREDEKKRYEYYSLLRFLWVKRDLLTFNIRKEERPDFVLTDGSKEIGIEVTEFVTEEDSILRKICGYINAGVKTGCELQAMGRKKYRRAADVYIYGDRGGVPTIRSPVYGMEAGRNHYAKLIISKFKKYNEIFSLFDEFIILCDARKCLEVTKKRESAWVIALAQFSERRLGGCTVCILRVDENSRIDVDIFRLPKCENA